MKIVRGSEEEDSFFVLSGIQSEREENDNLNRSRPKLIALSHVS